MIVLTQLVYVVPGREADFHAFEDAVLPLLGKYGGELLLRLRPPPDAVIAGTLEAPYEVHLVQFPDEDALARYGADDDRRRVLHRKDASVRSAWLVRGQRT